MLWLVVFVCLSLSSGHECPTDRCMIGDRIQCNQTSTAVDKQCCPGYQCIPFEFPGNWFQRAVNTTMCVASDETHKYTRVNPQAGIIHTPPILEKAWSAQSVYVNTTNLDTGWGGFYYDVRFQALRIDFNPTCPFLQLRGDPMNVDSNYIPCSMIFYEGMSYYIYPMAKTCCQYQFPVWYPDWMCSSNATYGGTTSINGVEADLFSVEWFSNFTMVEFQPFSLINVRNMYVKTGTNMPLRFQEDLDTGFIDFFNYSVGEQDESIFTDLIDAYQCHPGFLPSQDRTCIHYAPVTQRGDGWPCDSYPNGFCVNIPP